MGRTRIPFLLILIISIICGVNAVFLQDCADKKAVRNLILNRGRYAWIGHICPCIFYVHGSGRGNRVFLIYIAGLRNC